MKIKLPNQMMAAQFSFLFLTNHTVAPLPQIASEGKQLNQFHVVAPQTKTDQRTMISIRLCLTAIHF